MTAIVFSGLLGLFFVSLYITHENNMNIAKDTIIEQAEIFAELFQYISQDSLVAAVEVFAATEGGTRFTIISSDGLILADSYHNTNAAENRLNRPEIQAAAQDRPTANVRFSDTFGANFIYYALKVPSGESYVFIRTAVPVAQIETYLRQILPMSIIILLGIAVICLFLAHRVAAQTTAPIFSATEKLRLLSQGKYTSSPTQNSFIYSEIGLITKKIDEVAVILQGSFDALRDEKNKLAYICDNIGDGLFVVDENFAVSLVNAAATRIFDTSSQICGRELQHLISDKYLTVALEECLNHSKDSVFESTLNGRIYLTTVKRLLDTKQAMVALLDVTESRENAKRREEFFANASHELKTPLTAIKVFNELTAIGNRDAQLDKHIAAISRESDRMMSLIANMLKLSELESTKTTKPAKISLAKIVNEVCETLSATFEEKSLTFALTGDVIITSESAHIYELVKNLIENAARYNRPNGRISAVIQTHKSPILIISDNGIGIPPKEQVRIFERFYRVEKSRSASGGGTGLGLAIVKHICSLYDWSISLKSKPGEGTIVTINFK
ncbi:MAG: ATP-binding protein [Turicibacter sp.]|nr:ATP-binding protein [Turicibacter sp.]